MARNQDLGITSTTSLLLDLPPSCIEFCPSRPQYFVVGTYNLQKDDVSENAEVSGDVDAEDLSRTKKAQSRDGSLVLFRLQGNEVSHVQTVPYPSAILDLHFHPQEGKQDTLAVVSSTGSMSFFRLSDTAGDSHLSLLEVSTQRPLDKDAGTLFLSCAWHASQHDLIAVTTSDFEVHILQVGQDWTVTEVMSAPAITHTLEAWTVAFSPQVKVGAPMGEEKVDEPAREMVVYSGGDDSKLLYRSCTRADSLKGGDEELVQTVSPATNIKGHGAGVTAILPLDFSLEDGSSVVVSGSYDDHIRVFAVPESGMRARVLAEANLGGGVWRLKLIKAAKSEAGDWTVDILASCMHAGSRVVKISGHDNDDSSCVIKVLGRFEEHKSMNYGSDFQPGCLEGGGPLRCVSTSFYDRLLCYWTHDMEA